VRQNTIVTVNEVINEVIFDQLYDFKRSDFRQSDQSPPEINNNNKPQIQQHTNRKNKHINEQTNKQTNKQTHHDFD
jgi:hypothetical protein